MSEKDSTYAPVVPEEEDCWRHVVAGLERLVKIAASREDGELAEALHWFTKRLFFYRMSDTEDARSARAFQRMAAEARAQGEEKRAALLEQDAVRLWAAA
jgi:hypothetical protein